MRRSERLLPKLPLFAVIIVVAMLAGWWMAHQSNPKPTGVESGESLPMPVAEERVVHLYFSDQRDEAYLVAEQRVMAPPVDDTVFGRWLVAQLVSGPQQGAGGRTLPKDALLSAFFITDKGKAIVDFASESFAAHPGGIRAELLSIYSVVNTLVMNVTSIRSVKFLIDGREAETLAGHVDLQDPFEVDMMWVR
ncbi:MAG: GerMN domain-containing protein [Desulfatitalea sp.]|nr:GerMN domain-containing protein [Desulfatitalea sp.]NNK01307.1 GerMN domain-containing protein [Desulfatitalea sp.]